MEMALSAFVATVSSKNQVTLPAGIRKHLEIGPGDMVVFVVDSQGVHIRPHRLRISDPYGSVSVHPGQSGDIDEQIEQAMNERAAEVVTKSRET